MALDLAADACLAWGLRQSSKWGEEGRRGRYVGTSRDGNAERQEMLPKKLCCRAGNEIEGLDLELRLVFKETNRLRNGIREW